MTMRRAFLALAASLLVANAWGAGRPGVNYTLIANPQAPTVASGKVEVSEFFWYGCGHCYALDPALEEWNGQKAEFIEFVRVPVIWGPVHRQHAKLFYTLQALHRPELHSKVFDAIHRDGLQLAGKDEVKARTEQQEFLAGHGITKEQFDAVYDSMSVTMKVQRAEAATQALEIANVPTLVINGKYSTGVTQAGGEGQLFALIEELAASEKR